MIYAYDKKNDVIKREVINVSDIEQFNKNMLSSYGDLWSYDYWELLEMLFYYFDDSSDYIKVIAESKKFIMDS